MVNLLTLATDPVEHVIDKQILGSGGLWIVSNATVMLVLSAAVTALIVIPAARRIATGSTKTIDDYRAQGTLANLVEAICLYLREEVFKPVLGEQTDRFVPMLWTFFWFILVNNLMGLIPLADITGGLMGMNHGHGIGGTATQSIWVTAGLSVTAFLFWNSVAFIKDPLGYLKHLTAGAPWFMWPIMIPVEIMGMFVKPVALSLRLFANMTGGHIIIAVLLGFIPQIINAFHGSIPGYGIAALPLLGAVAINILEVLVAFIQAYIFTFLTCIFLGQLVVHEHEEGEHGHGEDHGQGHDHGHAHGAHAH